MNRGTHIGRTRNEMTIKVKLEVAPSVSAASAEVRLIEVRKEPSQAETQLKAALRQSKREHTYSIAQLVGIYPA
jgi:carbon monoxide dehydrogenase subunit G